MKTTTQSLVIATALAALLFGTSCKTRQLALSGKASASPQTVPSSHSWYAVRKESPVYFPVGVPEDSGTDYRHGEWVFAGEGDAMYFVPLAGNGEQTAAQLMEQAFAMRTEEQKRLIARDKRREKTVRTLGGGIGLTAVGTLTAATVAGATYGGGYVPDPGSTAQAYAEALEGSALDNLLAAVRHSGPELYPAEVLADFQRGRAGGDATATESFGAGSIDESDLLLHEKDRGTGNAAVHPQASVQ